MHHASIQKVSVLPASRELTPPSLTQAYACLACGPSFEQALAASPEMSQAFAELPRLKLAQGQYLLHLGDDVDSTWWVASGLARAYVSDGRGQERNTAFFTAGDWIGLGVPPQLVVSSVQVQALQALQLVRLSYAQLRQWLDKGSNNAAQYSVSAMLADALRELFDRQAQRQAQLLLMSASERYQHLLAEAPPWLPMVAQHQVASYLGVTDVALSRIRKRLGLIGK